MALSSAAKVLSPAEREMEKHLHGIYSRAQREVGEKWTAYMKQVDAELKPLQDAYAAAKRSGDKAEIKRAGIELGRKQREKTINNKYFQDLTNQLAGEISHINEQAVAYLNGQLPGAYVSGYNEVASGVNSSIKGYSFTLADENTIKNLATSDKTLLPYKKVNGKKDVRWNTQKVNGEVMHGILQGDSASKIAGRLTDVLGMNEASAIRNARTSMTSAQNKGRFDMLDRAQDDGIIVKKRWVAALDDHTRDTHAEMDGEEQDYDEPFSNELMYPGDPDGEPAEVYNCRCRMGFTVVGVGAAKDAVNVDGKQIEFSEKMDSEKWNEPKAIINELTREYKTKLQTVSPGSHKSAGSVQISGSVMHLSSSAPDVAFHEFAHTISMENQTKFGLYDESAFWNEIKRVKRQYRKEVGDDTTRWISVYEHGSRSTDEFMAEAFAQAKMAEMGFDLPDNLGKDLTYSKRVLEIIDKYFKKK